METSFRLERDWPVEVEGGCSSLKQYLDWASALSQRGYYSSFRGVDRCYGNLRPSIDRRQIEGNAVDVESELLIDFLKRAWNYLTLQEKVRFNMSKFRWGKRNTGAMVVARHRLVPTRCLDWSYNCLCALYFACAYSQESDGEVWWFDRWQFDRCVAAQWPSLFGKFGYVEDDLERDFIEGKPAIMWFTAFEYMKLPGDRMDRQQAWMTVAGRLGTCHAEEIHRIGLRSKGRLRILAGMKKEAERQLVDLGITRESLGLDPEPADTVAEKIRDEFNRRFPCEWNAAG